ncbi:MAG: class I SAM-dependent methyltransferase [Nitrospirota bacterium]
MGLSREQKAQMIKRVKYWYHTIDLGDGLVTPGWEKIKKLNENMIAFLPTSFKGISVLDVGCWDGLFSFETERRGASRVMAIDNLAGGDGFSQKTLDSIKGEGFKPLETARAILGSNIEYGFGNVYDLSPEVHGKFDCTIFFGVLYHLWHPMLALERIKKVTTKCLFIETHVNEEIDQSVPLIRFYPRGEKYEASTWVGPNMLALYEMLKVVGFKEVMLFRFRDHHERAIGMAFVEEKYAQEFAFRHDGRFIPFEPAKKTGRPNSATTENEPVKSPNDRGVAALLKRLLVKLKAG